MKRINSFICLLTLLFATASLTQASRAATVEAPPPATLSHRMAEQVDLFAEESILRPTDPFQLVPEKDPNGWSFMLEPYAWALGLEGQVGAAGLPPSHLNVSAIDVLRHLDWGIFSKAEIRKGRWGFLATDFLRSFPRRETPQAGSISRPT